MNELLNKEQKYFLLILADYIHKRKTKAQDGLNWSIILRYAKSHQVEGIIWNQCRDFLESENGLDRIRKQLMASSVASLYYYANNHQAYKDIKNELNNENICYFFVKGIDIATLYPVPGYRTMGDIDIVIHSRDSDNICKTMHRLGFQHESGERVKVFVKSTIKLEIHELLVNEDVVEISKRRNFFNKCWEFVKKTDDGSFLLDWNFHFLFLIEHTKQHFSANGVGFRQFMDLAIVSQNKDLDWVWIESVLREIKLWDFTVMTFAFMERWWDIRSPMSTTEIKTILFQESTDFIFRNGVFGFDNKDTDIHMVEMQMRISSFPKFLRSISVAIKKVCLSYNTAVMLPYCSFVKGRKMLLPFVWIYRVFYVAKHKKGNISRAIKLVFGSREVIDYHRRLMDDWGV